MKAHRLAFFTALAFAAPIAPASTATAPVSPAATAKAVQPGPARPYTPKICLVTDSDLDSMGDEVSIVYEGQVIKFCCRPCEKKFRRAPQKYLAKLAALEAGQK